MKTQKAKKPDRLYVHLDSAYGYSHLIGYFEWWNPERERYESASYSSPYRDVRSECQGNHVSGLYCADTGFYGFELYLNGRSSMRDIERALPILRGLTKKLSAMSDTRGSVRSAGEWFARLAEAAGCDLIKPSLKPDDRTEHAGYSIGTARDVIDRFEQENTRAPAPEPAETT